MLLGHDYEVSECVDQIIDNHSNEEAVGNYCNEFVDDFDIEGAAAEFGDWLSAHRTEIELGVRTYGSFKPYEEGTELVRSYDESYDPHAEGDVVDYSGNPITESCEVRDYVNMLSESTLITILQAHDRTATA